MWGRKKSSEGQIASREKIEKFAEEIQELFEASGFSWLLLTDGSRLSDLGDLFYTSPEIQALAKRYRIEIKADDYFWEVAERMWLNRR